LPSIITEAGYVTFINIFRCQPADQEEVVGINIDIVEQVASISPGFISAAVHRSSDGTRVINYLQWESSGHLAAMQRSPEFQAIARRFAGLIEFEPHECEVAHVAEGRRRSGQQSAAPAE
jgi:quinol monooxygenase YgiN